MTYGIRNILVATDLGPRSGEVLKHAAGIAQRFGAQLHLVTVMHSSRDNSMVALDSYLSEETISRLREDAIGRIRERIDELVGELRKDASLADVASVGILEGIPADVVIGEAKRLGADLIVLGSSGHSPVGEILIGSVAHRVTVNSTVPVLLVPINH